jgi:hypothetical protein
MVFELGNRGPLAQPPPRPLITGPPSTFSQNVYRKPSFFLLSSLLPAGGRHNRGIRGSPLVKMVPAITSEFLLRCPYFNHHPDTKTRSINESPSHRDWWHVIRRRQGERAVWSAPNFLLATNTSCLYVVCANIEGLNSSILALSRF